MSSAVKLLVQLELVLEIYSLKIQPNVSSETELMAMVNVLS